MVLVSSPKGVIQGVNLLLVFIPVNFYDYEGKSYKLSPLARTIQLGEAWSIVGCARGNKKAGHIRWPARFRGLCSRAIRMADPKS